MKRLLAISAFALLVMFAGNTTSASAHGSTIGEGLRLAGASPFHGQTALAFRINHDMRAVDLSVYSVTGKLVVQLQHGPLSVGDHTYVFSGRDLSAGVYLARLKTEHGQYVKRLILTQ
jgi:hypothetical protein